jgi:hypothetical protein
MKRLLSYGKRYIASFMFEEDINSTAPAENLAHSEATTAEHADSPTDRPVSEELPPKKYIERRNEQEEGSKNGVQKRLNKLTAQKYQLRNQNEELRSRLDAIEARLTPVERTELEAGRSNSDTEGPGNSRLTEEERQVNGSENGQRATPDEYLHQEQQRQQQVQTQYQERLGKLVENRPELWEKASRINIHPALLEVIKPALHEIDNGPELTAHLIENPAEVQKLHTMGPAAAIAYIGKISARLEAPKEKIRSKAEAPIQPVGGTARSTVPMEDLSPSEYIRLRNAQDAKRNGGYR